MASTVTIIHHPLSHRVGNKKKKNMSTFLEYRLPSSDACVLISQLGSPQKELNINKDSNIISSFSLPLLSIRFSLRTYDELHWTRPTHDVENRSLAGRTSRGPICPTLVDSLLLEYYPCIYTSDGMFYHAIRENMENLGKEFENNYRDDIIDDVIDKLREIVDDESNKGREKVEVYVGVVFTIEHFLDESILSDDCVICFEELGKEEEEEELMCTPCSHVFHEDCIAKWFENGHSCPICRYDIS